MSIKHFVDLPVAKMRALMDSEHWTISEKFDGSYIRAGVDEQGFYTNRKGNRVYRHVDDWDDKPWTNAFRAAHVILQEFTEAYGFSAGHYVDVEIINGSNPNTVLYPFDFYNSLILINSNHPNLITSTLSSSNIVAFASTNEKYWMSYDGITLTKDTPTIDDRSWTIIHNNKRPLNLDFRANYGFPQFLNRTIMFRGGIITNGELLETNLNKVPEWWDAFVMGEYSENRAANVAEIKARRQKARDEMELMYENTALSLINIFNAGRALNSSEGVVCQISLSDNTTETVKFVPRRIFSKENHYSHWVRYCLQGQRRPERPSFVTRTAHWPVDKRLARLEQLRKRYLDHNNMMNCGVVSYRDHSQLHLRTLALFAELRERIQNGWTGI